MKHSMKMYPKLQSLSLLMEWEFTILGPYELELLIPEWAIEYIDQLYVVCHNGKVFDWKISTTIRPHKVYKLYPVYLQCKSEVEYYKLKLKI